MGLREDLKAYTDADGLVSGNLNPPRGSEGNLILHTCEALGLQAELGEIAPEDGAAFVVSIRKCRIAPGLYQRVPIDLPCTDGEQEDDIHGLAYAAYVLKLPGLAAEILSYLRATGDVYNDRNPGVFTWRAWLGRFPALMCQLQYAAGEKPSILSRAYTALSIVQASISAKRNQDPWILNRLIIKTVDMRCWMIELATWIYLIFRDQNFPGGMAEVNAVYFNNPNHPLAVYAVGKGDVV